MDQSIKERLESVVIRRLIKEEKGEYKDLPEESRKTLSYLEKLVQIAELEQKSNAEIVRAAVEEKKIECQGLTPGKVALELGKVIVPTLITIGAYNTFQKRVIKFEETGRLVSTASRELHLPKFGK